MNSENIRKLAALLREPETAPHFDLSYYFRTEVRSETPIGELIHQCGTVACIAGWAAVLAAPHRSRSHYEIVDTAQSFLGLSFEQAMELFEPHHIDDWDEITAEKAAQVLDHLAETGEVDWSIVE